MSKDWTYGGHHKQWPIEPGEVWGDAGHRLGCLDWVRNDPAAVIQEPTSMAYVDPPWNTGNINSFRTKAKVEGKDQFESFFTRLLELLAWWSPRICYCEMGAQHLRWCLSRIASHGASVDATWKITYYHRLPCYLIRFGWTVGHRWVRDAVTPDFDGMDDEDTPRKAIEVEMESGGVASVLDLCTGQGATLRAALACGARFVGTELNKHRLACALDDMARAGLNPRKLD